MSRDGSGNYTLPAGVNPVVAATTITDDWANTTLQDVATALTDSLDRQGRGAPLANISMGSFKLTTLAAATAAADAPKYSQVVNQDAVTIASASTVDLAANLQSAVSVTGTTTITSFGTGAASGVRKFITFTGALTLTHSSTLICPGSTNISIAAGDSIEVKSEGSNIWRVTNYQSGGGLSTRLSQLAAATAANTIANVDYTQTWAWDSLGSGDIGLQISGSSGSSLGTLMQVKWSSPSGLPPAYLFRVFGDSASVSTFDITGSSFTLRPAMAARAPGNGSDCTIGAQNAESATSAVNGGHMYVYGGNSGVTGTGGSVIIQPGTGTVAPGAVDLRDSGGGSVAKVKVNTTGVELSGTGKTVLNTKHTFVDNTNGAPTITSGGGTGVTIAGSDVAFEVVAGTGSPTTFTATFANAWATAPQIVLTGCSQAGVRLSYTATTTTVQISTDSAWSSGAKISVVCLGLQ